MTHNWLPMILSCCLASALPPSLPSSPVFRCSAPLSHLHIHLTVCSSAAWNTNCIQFTSSSDLFILASNYGKLTPYTHQMSVLWSTDWWTVYIKYIHTKYISFFLMNTKKALNFEYCPIVLRAVWVRTSTVYAVKNYKFCKRFKMNIKAYIMCI